MNTNHLVKGDGLPLWCDAHSMSFKLTVLQLQSTQHLYFLITRCCVRRISAFSNSIQMYHTKS